MWKQIELHNHTIESDGGMTVEELVSYLNSQGITAFSLTDHNTVSGQRMLPKACKMVNPAAEFMNGFELTSYFGHLLCQNVSSYIPWDDIDETCADKLLRRVHEAGGLAGPAHPFSIPSPFSNGMCWSMEIRDYRLVDFIEVINNEHKMVPDNSKAICWWENLLFDGFRIAAVSGMDLHRPVCMEDYFTTFIHIDEKDAAAPLSRQFDMAIRAQQTCVTRGPVVSSCLKNGRIVLREEAGYEKKPGALPRKKPYICQLRTKKGSIEIPMENQCCSIPLTALPEDSDAVTCLIFSEKADMEHLIAIAPPIFLPK